MNKTTQRHDLRHRSTPERFFGNTGLLLTGLILGLLFCVAGQPHAYTQQETAVTLNLPTFKTGGTRRYLGVVILRMPEKKLTRNEKYIVKSGMTVKEAKPDGSATLLFKAETATSYMDGKEVPLTIPDATGILTWLPTGKTTWTSDPPSQKNIPAVQLVSSLFNMVAELKPLLPTQPVRLGEPWHITSHPADLLPMEGNAVLTAGEPLLGQETLKLTISLAEKTKISGAGMHFEMGLILNRASGEILKFAQTMYIGKDRDYTLGRFTLLALGQDPKEDPKPD